MKLKTFEKVNVNIKTEYTVFHGDEPIDSFVVDYLGQTKEEIQKLKYYEEAGAKVRFVSVNTVTGNLSVTVEI